MPERFAVTGLLTFVIEQDVSRNTIAMWLEMEPHKMARVRRGAVVRTARPYAGVSRFRVMQIDQPLGRLYIVPDPEPPQGPNA